MIVPLALGPSSEALQASELRLCEVIKVGKKLGEGVIWDVITQAIWWTDIESSRIFQYQPERKQLRSWDTLERLCSFGFTNKDGWLIAAFKSGIALFNPEAQCVKWISPIEADNPRSRLNDG